MPAPKKPTKAETTDTKPATKAAKPVPTKTAKPELPAPAKAAPPPPAAAPVRGKAAPATAKSTPTPEPVKASPPPPPQAHLPAPMLSPAAKAEPCPVTACCKNPAACEPSPEAIAERAYFLWQKRGSPTDGGQTDWFEAVRQLRDEAAARA